jgi:hypothetical protein
MRLPSFLQPLLEPWFLFLAEDPFLRLLQILMLAAGVLVVFLVFYTTRDVLLRTDSFWYMLLCILLVAFLPVIGFFVYLLIRPARTIRERERDEMLRSILGRMQPGKTKKHHPGPR